MAAEGRLFYLAFWISIFFIVEDGMKFPNLRVMMAHRRVRIWELSAVLRMSDGYVSQRLNGRHEFAPHERTRLAEYFGVKEDWLFAPMSVPLSARREFAMMQPAVELR